MRRPKTEMFVVPRFGADIWLGLFGVTAVLSMFFYLENRNDHSAYTFFESLAGTYLSCLICMTGSVLVWRHVLPRIVKRRLEIAPWMLLHVGSAIIASGVVAAVASPLMFLIHPGMGPTVARYAAISATIGGLFSTPMLLVFRLRGERRQIQEQLAAERQQRLEAQLHALQARTSPHFLFNTLNSIASLIQSDPDLAESTIERMSSLFRYSLDSGATSSVPFSRELEAVEDYLIIQKTRFRDRFDFDLNVDPGLHNIPVPPLLLQPLVENAVVHGVSRRLSGGKIEIKVRRDENGHVVCMVRDNGGSVVGQSKGGSGTAVADLRKRLAIRYGESARLDTNTLEDGGFVSTVVFPLDAAA